MKHLKQNNETYFSHFLFALKVGLTMTLRGLLFIFHAIFPIIDMPQRWNIENTFQKVQEWKMYMIKRRDVESIVIDKDSPKHLVADEPEEIATDWNGFT